MNSKRDYDDEKLRSAFSSLRKLKAPEEAVRSLYARLEAERGESSSRRRGIVTLLRRRREVLVAVLATLLFAVPTTYWTTKRVVNKKPDARTYVVRFVYEDEDAASVSLLGDFNNWRKNEIVLERVGDSTLWAAEVTLQEGLYRYGFLVDGTDIVSDPISDLRMKDSMGNESSLMVLAGVRGDGGGL
jgi:hypothetical protein